MSDMGGGLGDRMRGALRALMGISTYESVPVTIDDKSVDEVRAALGGQIQSLPTTRTRWYLDDLETAQRMADGGDMTMVGQLARSMRRDGVISGLMGTRTSGLISLPKRWHGDERAVALLRADNTTRSLFDEMLPPAELALMAADGIGAGVGVGELLPVVGRPHPVLVRLEPEFLSYRWNENRWYYRSVAGLLPVTPGDGRWVLHTPGGRLNPWQYGNWHALGRAFVVKEHAILNRNNFSTKLANPARVAKAPAGATEPQREGFLARLIRWGLNNVIELPPGWDVELVESNGRGWEVFGVEVDTSNFEIMISLAGQIVTVTGGSGFANADIHQTIRADLIQQTGDALAHTLNTQVLPPWMIANFGLDSLKNSVRVEWDTDRSPDRAQEADALAKVSAAVSSLDECVRRVSPGKAADTAELFSRFGIPVIDAASVPAPLTLVEPAP